VPETGVVVWLGIGLGIGVAAKLIGNGLSLGGCFATLLAGLAGAGIAGWLATQLLSWNDTNLYHYDLFAAAIGAGWLLWFIGMLTPKRPY